MASAVLPSGPQCAAAAAAVAAAAAPPGLRLRLLLLLLSAAALIPTGHKKMSKLTLSFPCSGSGISYFPEKSWVLLSARLEYWSG
ncbi:cell adhesion molecule 1-like isoform X2 [Bubalus kerabau]|uniref:cell adhesion molecule 1-like isoform X2 n=1 Tax=Bubalus carabanensis TaxID=3119969 RepID=UPI00244E830B|nr:cell adhesion molecule 1-like isoform X2 [Bubalus carabanensis]